MRYLFELTGFEVVAEYSDFFRSLPAHGKEQLWVLQKALKWRAWGVVGWWQVIRER
jgi:hypothetical protein